MLLLAVAHAHVPHDTIRALAAPRQLVGDRPWLLVANPQGTSLLLRSDDGGATWAFIGGEPLMDHPTGALLLDDGTYVLLAEDRYWTSRNDAASWERADLPAGATLAAGRTDLRFAGSEGIWRADAGADPTLELADTVIVALADDVAADDAGGVWARDGSAWTRLGAPGPALRSLAREGDVVYAGAEDGTVWRWEEGWSACGDLPAADHPDVVAIVLDSGMVWAASGDRAGLFSTDGCATWEAGRSPDTVRYGAGGGASDVAQAWPVFQVAGNRVVAGGWEGLFLSEDGGRSWAQAAIVPPDHTRGLAFAPTFVDDGLVYVGGYAAGVLRTFDGGLDFDAPNHGLDSENVQRVYAPLDPEDERTLYTIAGHTAWRSDDRGESWEPFVESDADVSELFLSCASDSLWFSLDNGQVFSTTDGGRSARLVDLPLGSSEVVGLARLGGLTCITARRPMRLLCENAEGWSAWPVEEAESVTAPVAWPPGAPTRLVWADDAGVHLSDDAGASIRTPYVDEDPPATLVSADDGTLFLATRSGRILRSTDGAESWTDPGYRLSATPNVLAARPDFAAHPDLIAGTHDGAWLLSGTEPPVRWAAFQRVDDASVFFDRSGDGEPLADPAASMDQLSPLNAGSRYRIQLRGTNVRVLGLSAGGTEATLRVDGVSHGFGASAMTSVGALIEVTGLPDGWHEVVLIGGGEGLWFDAVEARGEGAILTGLGEGAAPEGVCAGSPWPPDPASPPCGCPDGGAGSAAGAFSLLAVTAARRRRAP